MAGMLPGVEMARRRRTHHHHDTWREPWLLHHHQYYRSRHGEPTTSTVLDDITLKARERLDHKLRGSSSSSFDPISIFRWSEKKLSKGRGSKSNKLAVASAKETRAVAERGETGYREDVCAVCLDEFQVQQQVMNLPCSHRYHSDCLLPWLNVHSHCPYCRTHVQS